MNYYTNTYSEYLNNNFSNNNMEFPEAITPDCNTSRSIEENSRTLSLEQAIMEIKKSITGEKDDEIFYSVLLSQAPNEEEKNIIKSIIADEKKHNLMFRKLYEELTKMESPASQMSRTNNSSNEYLKNLEKALFGELSAVERYRQIMFAMPNKEKYDMLMEILTDEIKHAAKYNYLITRNFKK